MKHSQSVLSPPTIVTPVPALGPGTAAMSIAMPRPVPAPAVAPSRTPESKSGAALSYRFGILDLPQELLDAITQHLSPANLVVLALVNKELLTMFTHYVLVTNPSLVSALPTHPSKVLGNYMNATDASSRLRHRGVLLSILDIDQPDLVYCYKCRKMHCPFVTFKDRLYAPQKSAKCLDNDDDNHIPPRATRKLLRSITKHRTQRLEYRSLLQQVNNTVTTCKAGHVVQVSLRMRYRDDDILLRRQQVVASVDKTAQHYFRFRLQLLDASGRKEKNNSNASLLLGSLPRVRRPCNHVSWMEKYQEVVDRLLLDPMCQVKKETRAADHRDHSTSCFSFEPCDVARQPGNIVSDALVAMRSSSSSPQGRPAAATALPDGFGATHGCDRCVTDFHLAIVPLPEPYGWGFVLTTWLDVGKIDLGRKWDSHRPDGGTAKDYRRDDDGGDNVEYKGSICARFEGLERGQKYVPSISELDLERLTNHGTMDVAGSSREGMSARLRSWSSEHTVDPATGRIVDPDPLMDDDY